jgi:hypothetical protein
MIASPMHIACRLSLDSIFYSSTAVVGLALMNEDSGLHSDSSHSVGFFWTSDRPVAENYIRQTQHLQKTSIHAYTGTRTRNPTRRAIVDPSLTERGHWNQVVDGIKELNPIYEVCNQN